MTANSQNGAETTNTKQRSARTECQITWNYQI